MNEQTEANPIVSSDYPKTTWHMECR